MKVLVVVDQSTGHLGATCVGQKGGSLGFVTKGTVKWLGSTGYSHVAAHHDAERWSTCCRLSRDTPQQAPIKSHASQGHVERSVRLVENLFRAILVDVQWRTQVKVEPTSAASAWMLRYSAWRLSPSGQHKGGASSFHRPIESPYTCSILPPLALAECSIPSSIKLGEVHVVAKGASWTFRARLGLRK